METNEGTILAIAPGWMVLLGLATNQRFRPRKQLLRTETEPGVLQRPADLE